MHDEHVRKVFKGVEHSTREMRRPHLTSESDKPRTNLAHAQPATKKGDYPFPTISYVCLSLPRAFASCLGRGRTKVLYDFSAAVPKNSSASVNSLGSTPTVSRAFHVKSNSAHATIAAGGMCELEGNTIKNGANTGAYRSTSKHTTARQ